MQIVVLDQVAGQPWRNAGGTTRELLTWPNGEDWSLRVSVADIDQQGPSSVYPDVDRWFTVAQGAAVTLRFAHWAISLTAASDPFYFDGATASVCELPTGSMQAFNVMIRRSLGKGVMLRAHANQPWRSTATVRAAFTMSPAQLNCNGETLTLEPGTLVWSDSPEPQPVWQLGSDSAPLRAWWLAFEPAKASV